MRGKGLLLRFVVPAEGITPAYAGKSLPDDRCLRNHRDHPRVCGEKRKATLWRLPALGSPPRMRGKAKIMELRKVLPGITPAYAGKSKRNTGGYLLKKDHPRVCGEKICMIS